MDETWETFLPGNNDGGRPGGDADPPWESDDTEHETDPEDGASPSTTQRERHQCHPRPRLRLGGTLRHSGGDRRQRDAPPSGFLYFRNQVSFATLRQWDQRIHWERTRASPRQFDTARIPQNVQDAFGAGLQHFDSRSPDHRPQ